MASQKSALLQVAFCCWCNADLIRRWCYCVVCSLGLVFSPIIFPLLSNLNRSRCSSVSIRCIHSSAELTDCVFWKSSELKIFPGDPGILAVLCAKSNDTPALHVFQWSWCDRSFGPQTSLLYSRPGTSHPLQHQLLNLHLSLNHMCVMIQWFVCLYLWGTTHLILLSAISFLHMTYEMKA